MGLDPISNIAAASGQLGDAVAKIIGLFKESPTVKAQLQHDIDLTELQGQIQVVLAQIQVNAVEAANKSVFVAGWRPGIGWVCGFGLAYSYILQPFLTFALVAFHINFDPHLLPVINTSELLVLVGGLLGLGGMRTYEKVQGKDAPGNIGH